MLCCAVKAALMQIPVVPLLTQPRLATQRSLNKTLQTKLRCKANRHAAMRLGGKKSSLTPLGTDTLPLTRQHSQLKLHMSRYASQGTTGQSCNILCSRASLKPCHTNRLHLQLLARAQVATTALTRRAVRQDTAAAPA
jgi:hypothetical protein